MSTAGRLLKRIVIRLSAVRRAELRKDWWGTMKTILKPQSRSVMTTDGVGFGSDRQRAVTRVNGGLTELTNELSTAMSDAYWSYMLQGELEEAFDAALLRAAIADTPVVSGRLQVWAI